MEFRVKKTYNWYAFTIGKTVLIHWDCNIVSYIDWNVLIAYFNSYKLKNKEGVGNTKGDRATAANVPGNNFRTIKPQLRT